MKNIDVEIYLNQFINFFEKNPNDLIELIGDSLKEEFFDKVEKQCYKNHENGDDISLTQKQIIDIVIDLKNETPKNVVEEKVIGVFQHTKFGMISLN
jgi:hypothetical protein